MPVLATVVIVQLLQLQCDDFDNMLVLERQKRNDLQSVPAVQKNTKMSTPVSTQSSSTREESVNLAYPIDHFAKFQALPLIIKSCLHDPFKLYRGYLVPCLVLDHDLLHFTNANVRHEYENDLQTEQYK